MVKTYNYLKAGLWFRPIIPITLKLNHIEFDYLALIDSGADFNIFHADIARILQVDLKRLKSMTFSGIKENAKGVGHFTAIQIGMEKEFFNSPVIFSSDISNNGYGILGQQGFFNHFKVEFDYSLKRIYLRT